MQNLIIQQTSVKIFHHHHIFGKFLICERQRKKELEEEKEVKGQKGSARKTETVAEGRGDRYTDRQKDKQRF